MMWFWFLSNSDFSVNNEYIIDHMIISRSSFCFSFSGSDKTIVVISDETNPSSKNKSTLVHFL